MIPVITIDGPSGSGKGTISRLLARKLGWHFLDSGALYRILALIVIRENISITELSKIVHAAANLKIEFKTDRFLNTSILLASEDITNDIRSEECGIAASKVAAIPEVRAALLDLQRGFRCEPGLIADGRDMGTVVFKDAKFKFFLTASQEKRALRRCQQLQEQGINVSLRSILRDLQERDERDRNRQVAPLISANDAIIIDTTDLSIEEVLQRVIAKINV